MVVRHAFSSRLSGVARAAEDKSVERFRTEIEPIIERYCLECHGNGLKKGGIELDAFDDDVSVTRNRDLWRAVLRNVRAGIMPPPKKPRPNAEETKTLADWIKRDAFGIDPADPDPGRVTIRRLNRIEYRRTIKDLMGIDYNTTEEFPPDDTGYGFDTIGDVLNVSPLLLEKYAQAAETIVTKAVPTVSKLVRETSLVGRQFRDENGGGNGDRLSFYKEAKLAHAFSADKAGNYKIALELIVQGAFDFDPGRCLVIFRDGNEELLHQEFSWSDRKKYDFEFDRKNWSAGEHRLSFELQPLTSIDKKSSRWTSASARFASSVRWTRSLRSIPPTTNASSPWTNPPRTIPNARPMPETS